MISHFDFLVAIMNGTDYVPSGRGLLGDPLKIYLERNRIIDSFLEQPNADEMIKSEDYVAFTVAANNDRVSVLKKLLSQPLDHVAMISADDFSAFHGAISNRCIAVVDMLISVCDKQLLRKMIRSQNFSVLYPRQDDLSKLVRIVTAGLYPSIGRSSNPGMYPSPWIYGQIDTAITYSASPTTILEILNSGRHLLGWVLAAKNASIHTPSEIINVIFSHIDPRWRKIIVAMQPKKFDESGIPRADNLIRRARFLQAAL